MSSERETVREREIALRETAYAERGKLIEGSGTEVAPHRLGQMVSVRLQPDLASALRELAEERNTTLSELLREAAAALVTAPSQPTRVSYEVHVPSVTVDYRSRDYSTGSVQFTRASG